jgi:hypothetical protein
MASEPVFEPYIRYMPHEFTLKCASTIFQARDMHVISA